MEMTNIEKCSTLLKHVETLCPCLPQSLGRVRQLNLLGADLSCHGVPWFSAPTAKYSEAQRSVAKPQSDKASSSERLKH